ncbi:hypothetical protein KC19_6G094400 [Ceratodon purpureus]|uniref:Uncharacterized protein n=1 Tax=Ceratodon purpureus TaxID=3225 RepID=A0A8T0HIK4_CERPU|nr:hypothetical protein KC19_6G094400 [Ceratodon purpureus]
MPRNPKLPYTLPKIPEQFATTTSKSAHNSGQHRRSTNQSTRFQPSNYIAAAMQDSQQSSAPMPNETEPAQNAQSSLREDNTQPMKTASKSYKNTNKSRARRRRRRWQRKS